MKWICRFFTCFSLTLASTSGAQELTLIFAGDAMQHKEQIDNTLRINGIPDYSSCFRYLKDEISSADIATVNLEAPLGGRPWKGYPCFSAPDSFAEALREAGFDLILTANNHCLDCRNRGLRRTLSTLDSLGIAHTGCFADSAERADRYPLIIEKNGFRIAMLNCTYGTNGIKISQSPPCIVNYIDSAEIISDIAKAKKENPDLIIANLHWGQEYKTAPDRNQEHLAEMLFDAGADIIVGNHPHVVQPIKHCIDSTGCNRTVAYSLGNFISAMSTDNTSGGVLLKIRLTKANGRLNRTVGYTLFFVNRTTVNGRINFELLPLSFPEDMFNPALTGRMQRFAKNARAVFEAKNEGAEEYFINSIKQYE